MDTLPENTTFTNPATAGLAGFGLSSLLLQFFNLGFIGEGPAVYIGAIFGGIVQLIVGFQFIRLADSFGYVVFISYGAFWTTLPLILIANHFGLFVSTPEDMGVLLASWALLSVLFTIVAVQKNRALGLMFICVVLGMASASLSNFNILNLTTVSAIFFILAAFVAWYIMLSALLSEQNGETPLPLGSPFFR